MSKRLWLDTHIHVSAYGPDGEPRDNLLDDLLAMLDACDADLRLVITPDGREMGRVAREPEAVFESNKFIHDLVSQAPGRLFGGCFINPNFLDESLRTIEACFGEWGFVHLGEMLQYAMNYKMDSDPVETVVRRAVEFGVPVHVHISTAHPMEHNSTWGMEQLNDLFGCVDRVPEASYILAHAVGMPDDDPPVVVQYLDAIEERFGGWPENFWMEIRDFDSPGVPHALARVPINRLLAGTDWTTRIGPPFLPYGTIFNVKRAEDNPYPPTIASIIGFLTTAGASDDDIERIGWRNAAELLDINLEE